jgi:hypothetical protein
MRLACVHCFSIDADTVEQGREILADLGGKISAASARLDIGYQQAFITGQPQPDYGPQPSAARDPEEHFR